jgi:hypothetical protein
MVEVSVSKDVPRGVAAAVGAGNVIISVGKGEFEDARIQWELVVVIVEPPFLAGRRRRWFLGYRRHDFACDAIDGDNQLGLPGIKYSRMQSAWWVVAKASGG